ncbi:PTS sugar transporter subunit IIA [uncultured Lactobacillus sp.]|uniref:PTS sugar transporter subunit IIA n=1 Tax=uncultured Lactobacillus sp. TaxID=153152 RepID=UPI0025E7DBCB|nr:PTS sugar transporter subunit IIA [uncultured Lactobacillus sp.]
MQSTAEFYAVVTQISNILKIAEIYIRKKAPNLSSNYIKRKIIERENLGETYVGHKTIILHVISTEITANFCLYLFLLNIAKWESLYSKKIHQVNKVMIICVNPKLTTPEFKFLLKFFNCRPEQVEHNFGLKKNEIYQIK